MPFTINSSGPGFLVPTNATNVTGQSSTDGPVPIEFDMSPFFGDPDIGSTFGASTTATHSARPLTQGMWGIVPEQVGAFTSPAPKETATSTMTATYRPFDSAVSTPTGDLWSAATDPATLSDFSPVIAQPGQRVTIPVKITPAAASGTTVKGTLYVDDTNLFVFQAFLEPNGNQVTSVPYEYTVKSSKRTCGGALAGRPPLQFVKHCARLGHLMASGDTCPVCRTAEIVCGKWTLLVIRDLADGRSRFCELERSLQGISPRTLSLRLRALEEEGIVRRQTFPEVPPRVEYALTEKGRALVPLIEDMRRYGREWLGADCDSVADSAPDREPAVVAA